MAETNAHHIMNRFLCLKALTKRSVINKALYPKTKETIKEIITL